MLARAEPARTARIVLGLAWRALSRVTEGAEVMIRAAADAGEATLTLDQASEPDAELSWIASVAEASVREMGGSCVFDVRGGGERVQLRFGKESAS